MDHENTAKSEQAEKQPQTTAPVKSPKKKMNKKVKITLISVCSVLAFILLTVIGYFIYVFAAYYRLPDNLELTVEKNESNGEQKEVPCGKELKVLTFNIGFGAYEPDYGFFMDGGTESRAFSKERLVKNMENIGSFLKKADADFLFLQEVDEDGTRSYHYDERAMLTSVLTDYQAVWAQNWDCPYLFYPITQPHGKNLAGQMTFSRYDITSAVRRSLPIESGLTKIVDLDRCYSVSRIGTENGKELVLYNVHLSAYTSDGKIAEEQIRMLSEDMKKEYEAGNYVICGGDFNKDLLGNSDEIFGKGSKEEYTWAQSFPFEMLENTGLSLKAPCDLSHPVPSCRNADGPYNENQFVVTVDGFIVSNNVTVCGIEVSNTGFAYSDHNPVCMTVILEKQDR